MAAASRPWDRTSSDEKGAWKKVMQDCPGLRTKDQFYKTQWSKLTAMYRIAAGALAKSGLGNDAPTNMYPPAYALMRDVWAEMDGPPGDLDKMVGCESWAAERPPSPSSTRSK